MLIGRGGVRYFSYADKWHWKTFFVKGQIVNIFVLGTIQTLKITLFFCCI